MGFASDTYTLLFIAAHTSLTVLDVFVVFHYVSNKVNLFHTHKRGSIVILQQLKLSCNLKLSAKSVVTHSHIVKMVLVKLREFLVQMFQRFPVLAG